MKTFLGILLIIIFIAVGLLIYLNWHIVSEKFWEYKFSDVVNAIITLVIAGFIVYLVNEKLNNLTRKRELLLSLVEKFHDELNSLYLDSTEYMETKENKLCPSILAKFKRISVRMNILNTISKDKKVKCKGVFDGSLINDILNLKILLTDKKFYVKKLSYTDREKEKFLQMYTIIDQKVSYCKINLFA